MGKTAGFAAGSWIARQPPNALSGRRGGGAKSHEQKLAILGLRPPMQPISRFPPQMRNGNDDDGFVDTTEVNTIGETIDQASPDLLGDTRLEIGERRYKPERLIKFVEEFITQTDGLLFVPNEGIIKFLLGHGQKRDIHGD